MIDPVCNESKYVDRLMFGSYAVLLIAIDVVLPPQDAESNVKLVDPGLMLVSCVVSLNLHIAKLPSIPANPLVPLDAEVPLEPSDPAVPLVPLVPEDALVPLDPLVPDVPLDPSVPAVADDPLEPEVPDVPSPPAAPPKLTSHTVYVPLPEVAVTLTDIAPVAEL